MTRTALQETDPSTDGMEVSLRLNSKALERLYEAHYEPILRYCVHRLFAKDAAEDVTSTVFLRVAERLDEFRGSTERQFRNWVYAIATNTVNQHLRQSARRQKLLQAIAIERTRQACVDAPGSPADDDTLSWPALYEAILALKPTDQALITLRFFEQLKTDQIAEILGKKSGAVRVALTRALRRLRRFLTDTDQGSRR